MCGFGNTFEPNEGDAFPPHTSSLCDGIAVPPGAQSHRSLKMSLGLRRDRDHPWQLAPLIQGPQSPDHCSSVLAGGSAAGLVPLTVPDLHP